MRYLVTGGHGFLGTVLCRRLRETGIRDHDLLVPGHQDCDLLRQTQTERLFRETRPDVVIHLAAAVGGIGANRANPGAFFYANLAMGMHVIECARQYQTQKVVVIGSICSYPKHTPVPFCETHLWQGYPEESNAPYGIAKLALLVMCQAYRQQYGLNAIYLLPVNLYGPGDNFDPQSSHVIPALIKKCREARLAGAPYITAWGTGAASREFLYVEDAAEGVLKAAQLYNDPDPVNLGAGCEITIGDLTRQIARLCHYPGEIRWDPSKPDGQPRRCLDVTRARDRFDFMARTPFEEGLRNTIAWYEQTQST